MFPFCLFMIPLLYIYIFFDLDFILVWCKVNIQFYTLSGGYIFASIPFIEQSIFIPNVLRCNFDKISTSQNYLGIFLDFLLYFHGLSIHASVTRCFIYLFF